MSGDTIVVSALDGTTLTVKTSATTVVTKSVDSSVGALAVGQTIRAIGTTATDGSVSATSITEGNAGGFGGFGGFRPRGNGSSTSPTTGAGG